MRVYDARSRRRPRWKRIALWSAVILLTLVLATAGAVAFWAKGLYDQIGNLDPDVKRAQGDLSQDIPTPNQPATALVIGSDHRSTDGAGPSRSDTLMLVRIDPATKEISMLSLPRDLWVPINGVCCDKINAAYSGGGVKLALRTVQDYTGIKVNYLVVVDFSGFTRLVNTFDGVYVNVDQYYFHENTPGTEQYSEINIPPGYQLLKGDDALAFARYRHTDSDFYRNARQQLVLQAFQATASEQLQGIGIDQLGTFRDVAETIADNVQVTGPSGAPSIQKMIEYAGLAYETRGNVNSVKLEAGLGGDATNSYVVATDGCGAPGRLPVPAPRAAAEAARTRSRPGASRPRTRVQARGQAGDRLRHGRQRQRRDRLGRHGRATRSAAFGYPDVGQRRGRRPASITRRTRSTTGPASRRPPPTSPRSWATPSAAPLPAAFTYASDIVVVVGKPFTGKTEIKPPKQAAPSGLPPDMIADNQAYLPLLPDGAPGRSTSRSCTRRCSRPGSVFDDFTTTQPIRLYNIRAAGNGWNSMYAVFQMSNLAGAYWGIEETRFMDAPILKDPDLTRKLDGRTYRFYFNGEHIHLIAIVQSGVAYWVTNTLRDDLSNQAMIAIARSLKPVA